MTTPPPVADQSPFDTHCLAAGQQLQSNWGATFRVDEEGFMHAHFPVLRSVGVMNLAEVHSHDVVRVAQFTTHAVRFLNGGLLEYAYNDRGALMRCFASANLEVFYTAAGLATVYALPPGTTPANVVKLSR